MSIILRIILIAASLLSTVYVLKKIRKAQLQIQDSIFWIFLSFILIIVSVFPKLGIYVAQLIGIISPVNFIFLLMIFILFLKVFTLSLKVSHLESMIRNLAQEYAINNESRERDIDEE